MLFCCELQANNSGIIFISPSIIISPMFILHFFFYYDIFLAPRLRSRRTPILSPFFLVQIFHTRLFYLAYLTYLFSISSLLCLYLSLCVTVWRFVLCSVHAIPGSRPDGPRLRRNVKGPRNPMSISIKYIYTAMLCNSDWQGSAALFRGSRRISSRIGKNIRNHNPRNPGRRFRPPHLRRWIVQNELSSDNQSISGAVLKARIDAIFL